jgi:hypothetical protein
MSMPDNDTDENMIPQEPQRPAAARGEPDGGVHEATAYIPHQQVRPVTSPFNNNASILLAANAWSGAENATSKSTLRVSNPYSEAMKSSLQASGTGEATA